MLCVIVGEDSLLWQVSSQATFSSFTAMPPPPPPSTLHFVYGQRHKVITSGQKWPKTVKSAWKSPLHESLTNGSYRYRFEKSVFTISFRRIWAGAVCSYHRIGRRTTPSFGWNHQLLCVGHISDDNSPVCLLHSRLEASQYCTVRTGFTILVFLVVRQIRELKEHSS